MQLVFLKYRTCYFPGISVAFASVPGTLTLDRTSCDLYKSCTNNTPINQSNFLENFSYFDIHQFQRNGEKPQNNFCFLKIFCFFEKPMYMLLDLNWLLRC